MKKDITLVDHGRGLQLSTSRITVQDLVPYFQDGCPHEEIMRWLPTLSDEEISVVEQYYREHKEALDEEDRRIREVVDERVRRQQQRFPQPTESPAEKLARLQKLLHQRTQEKNGEGHSGGRRGELREEAPGW